MKNIELWNICSRTSSVREEHQPISYYTTSYGRHYNQNAFIREQTDKSMLMFFIKLDFFNFI